MSQSVLLHALSLNDRILEPNKLPLCGHVWAFEKALMSKEMFVGNCISVLSLLGSQDATINWQDDLMAFDTHLNGQTELLCLSLFRMIPSLPIITILLVYGWPRRGSRR